MKGLAMVKKHWHSIVKLTLADLIMVLNSRDTDDVRYEKPTMLMGKISVALPDYKIPVKAQMNEVHFNGQHDYKWVDTVMSRGAS